jgi:hypothetical protein
MKPILKENLCWIKENQIKCISIITILIIGVGISISQESKPERVPDTELPDAPKAVAMIRPAIEKAIQKAYDNGEINEYYLNIGDRVVWAKWSTKPDDNPNDKNNNAFANVAPKGYPSIGDEGTIIGFNSNRTGVYVAEYPLYRNGSKRAWAASIFLKKEDYNNLNKEK